MNQWYCLIKCPNWHEPFMKMDTKNGIINVCGNCCDRRGCILRRKLMWTKKASPL
jgi:sulfur relay (sulfurtransferase) complex TusBCD TusD component (DsrE family)